MALGAPEMAHTAERECMNEQRTVIVASFNDNAKAEFAKDLLRSHGIIATLNHTDVSNAFGFLNIPITLVVFKADEENAKALLKEHSLEARADFETEREARRTRRATLTRDILIGLCALGVIALLITGRLLWNVFAPNMAPPAAPRASGE